VRHVITRADARLTEEIQYGIVQFVYKSGLYSFVQVKRAQAHDAHVQCRGPIERRLPSPGGQVGEIHAVEAETDVADRRAMS
jgi:hypothetical protein